jgi:hypothetical protein
VLTRLAFDVGVLSLQLAHPAQTVDASTFKIALARRAGTRAG